MCVCARVCACVCVCACVRACVCVCVFPSNINSHLEHLHIKDVMFHIHLCSIYTAIMFHIHLYYVPYTPLLCSIYTFPIPTWHSSSWDTSFTQPCPGDWKYCWSCLTCLIKFYTHPALMTSHQKAHSSFCGIISHSTAKAFCKRREAATKGCGFCRIMACTQKLLCQFHLNSRKGNGGAGVEGGAVRVGGWIRNWKHVINIDGERVRRKKFFQQH